MLAAVLCLMLASAAQAAALGDLFDFGALREYFSEDDSSGEYADDERDAADDKADDQDDAEEGSAEYYETLDVEEGESYDTKDEVCAYLVQYHELPPNYMTKKEARKKGWESGALHFVIDGMCIGGDVFGNYDENLPEVDGRTYHECDIDTLNWNSRGSRRIVYSGDDDNGDWNIYYTGDHYETFTLLYGDDE